MKFNSKFLECPVHTIPNQLGCGINEIFNYILMIRLKILNIP